VRTFFLVAIGVCLVGCEDTAIVTNPTSASASAAVTGFTGGSISATSFVCSSAGIFVGASAPAPSAVVTPNVSLVVTAPPGGIFVDNITLHLTDGSNVGGASVTFPRAGLDSLFANTFVRASSQRTFVLRPAFSCGGFRPFGIGADVVIINSAGARQTISTTVPLP